MERLCESLPGDFISLWSVHMHFPQASSHVYSTGISFQGMMWGECKTYLLKISHRRSLNKGEYWGTTVVEQQ